MKKQHALRHDGAALTLKTLLIHLQPENTAQLAQLCGECNDHLHLIERHLGIEIGSRGFQFKLIGPEDAVTHGQKILWAIYHFKGDHAALKQEINLLLQSVPNQNMIQPLDQREDFTQGIIKTPKIAVKPRGVNQLRYVKRILQHDINFGIGPAGTGKTFIAVAAAVQALMQEKISRIVLVRPAVEAGEHLGFLPGDLSQKVDPYLRPMYDALYELMGMEKVVKLIEMQTIEIAPLAFMRGRTLNDSIIILDEAQNTTREQMKMFLTRIGFNSTAIINGDITQIDLPNGKGSGLRHAIDVLANINGISFTFFESGDVVRHPLVQRIVEAYESLDNQK